MYSSSTGDSDLFPGRYIGSFSQFTNVLFGYGLPVIQFIVFYLIIFFISQIPNWFFYQRACFCWVDVSYASPCHMNSVSLGAGSSLLSCVPFVNGVKFDSNV